MEFETPSPESAIRLEAARIQNALIDLALTAQGVAALVDRLAEAIGNPVALGDSLFHLLASSPVNEHGDPHRREAVQKRGTPRDVLDDPEVGAHFRLAATQRQPTHFPAFPEHGMELARLMAPVIAGDEVLGFLTVLEEQPFDSSLPFLLEQAAKIIAVELLTRRVALETELHLMTDFLGDLLYGRLADRDSLVRRAGFLGVDLFRSWMLLIVESDDHELMTAATNAPNPVIALHRLFEVVSRHIRQRIRRGIVVVQGDSVVVLVPTRDARAISAPNPYDVAHELQAEISRALNGTTVSVAIDGPCETLEDFAINYAEACRALDIAKSLRRKNAVVSLEEFGLYGVLFRRDDQEYLARFIQRTLGPLFEYDQRRNSHLVQTLQMYLDEGAGFRATARQLGIHLNTLRARLDRIQEVTGIDLRSARNRTELAIALEIAKTSRDPV